MKNYYKLKYEAIMREMYRLRHYILYVAKRFIIWFKKYMDYDTHESILVK